MSGHGPWAGVVGKRAGNRACLLHPSPRSPSDHVRDRRAGDAIFSGKGGDGFGRRADRSDSRQVQNRCAALSHRKVFHVFGVRADAKVGDVNAMPSVARVKHVLRSLQTPIERDFHGGAMDAQALTLTKSHYAVTATIEAPAPQCAAIGLMLRAGAQDCSNIDKLISIWWNWSRGHLSIGRRHPAKDRWFLGRIASKPRPRLAAFYGMDGSFAHAVCAREAQTGLPARKTFANIPYLVDRQFGLVVMLSAGEEAALTSLAGIIGTRTNSKVRDLNAMRHITTVQNACVLRERAVQGFPKKARGNSRLSIPSNLRVAIPRMAAAKPKSASTRRLSAQGGDGANRSAITRVAGAGRVWGRAGRACFYEPMSAHLCHPTEYVAIAGIGQ